VLNVSILRLRVRSKSSAIKVSAFERECDRLLPRARPSTDPAAHGPRKALAGLGIIVTRQRTKETLTVRPSIRPPAPRPPRPPSARPAPPATPPPSALRPALPLPRSSRPSTSAPSGTTPTSAA
jgi:hypothetical protein